MLHWPAIFSRLNHVSPTLHCPALLAIECEQAGVPPSPVLDRDAADRFGAALSTDLIKLFPGIQQLDLVCAAALYDPAEILRPGWPVHAALGELHTRLGPGHAGSRVLSLGAHDGRMALPALNPDARLKGGAMLLMPWLLRGTPEAIAAIASELENDLLDRGMAGASLALDLRELFGFPIQHVRHMTLFDLCALTCSQYEHAGLGELWRLIESALLDPEHDTSITLPDGSQLRLHEGAVEADSIRTPRMFEHSGLILAAHGLSLSVAKSHDQPHQDTTLR